MKNTIAKRLRRRKQRIKYRLRDINWPEQSKPMFSAANIHYEIADRARGLAYGGIGVMHLLARETGLAKAIDQKLQLLKLHLPYRMIVLRKNLSVEKGEKVLFDDIRYFFYITNDRVSSAAKIVRLANERCNQENLIEQLKNGVKAMRMPVDNLVSNWAYMVMASLAWTLKAWFALSLSEKGRWKQKHKAQKQTVLKMEFKKSRNAFIQLPCQIIKTGRKIVYRILSWNQWLGVFFRGFWALRYSPG